MAKSSTIESKGLFRSDNNPCSLTGPPHSVSRIRRNGVLRAESREHGRRRGAEETEQAEQGDREAGESAAKQANECANECAKAALQRGCPREHQ